MTLTHPHRGIPGDPKVSSHYRTRTISDDTPRWSNLNGTISFGANGANTRSIQVFANIGDNGATFDAYHNHGFPPFAKVVQGWDVLLSVYKGYKEKPDMYKIEVRSYSRYAALPGRCSDGF